MSDQDERFASLADAMKTISERARDRATRERMLVTAVMTYPRLLCELLGIGQQQVTARCRAYIAESSRDGEGRTSCAILPPPPSRRAVNPERKKEARTRDAKTQLVRDLVTQAPSVTDHAAATRVARQVIDSTLALARNEFDERITANLDVRWGELTLEHLESLEINVPYITEIRDCMREFRDKGRIPDRKTPIRDVLSLDEIRGMKARCYAKRDAARHAVEALRINRG